jgi:hypothetical protein
MRRLRAQVLGAGDARRIHRSRAAWQRIAGDEPTPGAAESLRAQASWLLALARRGNARAQTVLVGGYGRRHAEHCAGHRAHADRSRHSACSSAPPSWNALRRSFRSAAPNCWPIRELLAQLALDAQRAANQPELAGVVDELRRAGFARTPARRDHPGSRPAKAGRCAIAPRAAPRSSSGATRGRTSKSPSSWRAAMTPGCTCAAHRAHMSSCVRASSPAG